ncbi:MAG: CHRD domain-containing protein, partial [Acidimicrobiia bacterium]|nr:CHRD domain-containing protein [Acidimicrobiia bacterium]
MRTTTMTSTTPARRAVAALAALSLLVVVLGASPTPSGAAPGPDEPQVLPIETAATHVARMDAGQEVHQPNSDARGVAVVSVDAIAGAVCFDISFDDPFFDADVTAAHIHTGGAGVDGPVLIDLDWPGNGPAGCVTASATDASSVNADPSGFYVNVHTVQFPAGEVRGQLTALDVATAFGGLVPLDATLSGGQEVPPVTTDGTGDADFWVDLVDDEFCYDVRLTDVDGITAAHIHQGVAGTNGPVVIGLDPTAPDFSACTDVDPSLLATIADNPAGFYINVHTVAPPPRARGAHQRA